MKVILARLRNPIDLVRRNIYILFCLFQKVPTIDILAITTTGTGFTYVNTLFISYQIVSFISTPFYSTSNVLSFLGLVGCGDRIAVASGLRFPRHSLPTSLFILRISFPFHSVPYLFTGWNISTLIGDIDNYMTSPKCLNQSVDIFLQPSPYEAVELIVYTLKYSQRPVDILVLGSLTNIAAAITRDRSIVPKIGTLYLSGK